MTSGSGFDKVKAAHYVRLYKLGSDVCGLPSQETYLDSQNIRSDAAKIGSFSEISKIFPIYFHFSPQDGL